MKTTNDTVFPCDRPMRSPRRSSMSVWAALTLAIMLTGCSDANSSKNITIALPQSIVDYQTVDLVKGYSLAAQAFRTKDPVKAMLKYQQAVSTYRELPAAWNNLGVLLMDENRYIQAQEAFHQASILAPGDPRPLYNLGLLYDRRGYIREARGYYAKALRRNKSYLPSLRAAVRADSILHEGSEETLEWLERALMLEHNDKWRDWMRLQRVRIENDLEPQAKS